MGKAFLCKSNGGGGGGLAFRVIGGTSAPSNPKPNDIWVNTSAEITSYIFSATEPEGYAEGMVWIETALSSSVQFNALKKNAMFVYPNSVYQYIGGKWESMNAYIYQNGTWVHFSADWDGELFAYGDEFLDITGGWVVSDSDAYFTNKKTIENGLLVFEAKEGGSGASANMYTKNPIDLTGKTTINSNIVEHINPSSAAHYLAVWKTEPTTRLNDEPVALKQIPGTETGTHSLDVSGLDGLYYVGLQIESKSYNSTYYIKTDCVWMK